MHHEQPQLRSAAQYLRMSRDSQRYSLENQADVIRRYAEENGYRIDRTFTDSGRSGLTARGREGLRDLLQSIVGGRPDFAVLLVLDVTRWGRYQDPDEAAHYEFLCRAAGVDVRYCAEAFEPGLAGSVLKHIKRVMAGEYSRELSQKVRAAKARRAIAGSAPGGTCRYGFRRQIVEPDGSLGRILERGERKQRPEQTLRLIPEGDEQSRVLRTIFRMFLRDHLLPIRISERLNANGVTWIGGKPWNKKRVVDVLRCDLVTGRQPFGKTTCRLGEARILNAYATWGFVPVFQPIVSVKTFNATQQRLRALKGGYAKTDEELLEDLRRIKASHGRVTLQLVQDGPQCQSPQTYYKRFGSFARAYALAGIEYEARDRGRHPDGSRMSREDIVLGIQRLYAERGRVSMPLCHADTRLPPLDRLRVEFGSLSEAFDAAGVPHRANVAARKRNDRTIAGYQPLKVPESRIFIGPYGGRYLVTASGRKRYGV